MKRSIAAVTLALALASGGGVPAWAAGKTDRVPFSEVFTVSADGKTISPKVQVTINDATIAAGTSVEQGTKVGGVDLFSVLGKDLAVVRGPGGVQIKGAWKK